MTNAELDALLKRLDDWADTHSFSRPVRDAAAAIRELQAELAAARAEVDALRDALARGKE